MSISCLVHLQDYSEMFGVKPDFFLTKNCMDRLLCLSPLSAILKLFRLKARTIIAKLRIEFPSR